MLRDLAEKISPILPERPNQGLLPEAGVFFVPFSGGSG